MTSDILTVKWPPMPKANSEVEYTFQKLLDTIKHYDIKRLLIDSRKSKTVTEDKVKQQLMQKLMMDFMATRLQKIARLTSEDLACEKKSRELGNALAAKFPGKIANKNFQRQPETLAWLKGTEVR